MPERSGKTPGICRLATELARPAANSLVADSGPALGEQLLDIAQAQREVETQPHRMADHVGREAVAFVGDRFHRAIA